MENVHDRYEIEDRWNQRTSVMLVGKGRARWSDCLPWYPENCVMLEQAASTTANLEA